MDAPRNAFPGRHPVATLASGLVLSMTAMSVGIMPALAEPDTEQLKPTTSVVETAPPAQTAEPPQAPESPPQVVVTQTETAVPEAEVSPEPAARVPEAATAAPPEAATAAPIEPKLDSSEVSAEVTTAVQTVSPPPPSVPATGKVVPVPEPVTATTSVVGTSSATVEPTSETPSPQQAIAPQPPMSSTSAEVETTTAQAAAQVETRAPQLLQAPRVDVELARNSRLLEVESEPAPKADVEAASAAISLGAIDGHREHSNHGWDRNVLQWDQDWVSYDRFNRPVIVNPYRDPVRIVYVYRDAPRVVFVPPLTRIALEVAEFAAYSFTAIVLNAVNTAVSVAVGSFFGGGYIPAVGLPLPPPPPLLPRYDNVAVQVRYSQAVYEPFRVQRILDVGDDRIYGERKVLLDGVTPAWGVWTQSPDGERQFEVHRTQQFPGLDAPREAPLPGDYRLRLTAEETSEMDGTRAALYSLAAVVVVLGIGALGWCALLGRRRQHCPGTSGWSRA